MYKDHHTFKQYNKYISISLHTRISHFLLVISIGHPLASAYRTILHSKAGAVTGILQKRNSHHLSDDVTNTSFPSPAFRYPKGALCKKHGIK